MLNTMFQEKKDGRLGKVINLRNELDEFMEYIGLSEKMQEMKILKVWNECVGDTISQFSKPVDIKKNKLYVSVENAVWRYELSARKEEILGRVNEILKNKKVKDIIFV
jgi:predicted nucleic acid-binding Zn ribbon protein